LRYHSRKEKHGAFQKWYFIIFPLFKKIVIQKLCNLKFRL
jgi:hypothetical protein